MNNQLKPRHPILVVDDETSILMAIDTSLRMAGFNNIITCQDSRKVMDIFSSQDIEICLMDLNMPHESGETLLSHVTQTFPDIPVIIVTGDIDMETAVRCIKAGAYDYVVKPVKKDRLIASVTKGLEYRNLRRENKSLKKHMLSDTLENPEAFEEIITQNKKMFSTFQYVESIAQTLQPVLITGETGVGKELFARAIHRLSTLKGQLVAVNVAGLDDNIFSDTLFGHVKGAFTGADHARSGLIEQAKHGTLFLDEIGDLTIGSQVKLLRLLQEGEYMPLGQDLHKLTDARIVVATNKDLWDLKEQGKFREDLIYRLMTHHFHIPPLKDRMDDLEMLCHYFLDDAAKTLGKKKPGLPKELIPLLSIHDFPGNIRELKALIFDALSRHKAGMLSLDVFRAHVTKKHCKETSIQIFQTSKSMIFPEKLPTIKQMSMLLVEEAMKRANNNQSIAASMLGISHQALNKRLKQRKESNDQE